MGGGYLRQDWGGGGESLSPGRGQGGRVGGPGLPVSAQQGSATGREQLCQDPRTMGIGSPAVPAEHQATQDCVRQEWGPGGREWRGLGRTEACLGSSCGAPHRRAWLLWQRRGLRGHRWPRLGPWS